MYDARHVQVQSRDVCSNLGTCQDSVIPFERYAGSWMWGRRQKEMTHPALLSPHMHLMHLEQAGILSPGSLPVADLAGPNMQTPISCAWHMPELNAFLVCWHASIVCLRWKACCTCQPMFCA